MDKSDVPDMFGVSCPTCGGVLKRLNRFLFACALGHSFSPERLDEAMIRQVDDALICAARAIAERVALCGQFAVDALEAGDRDSSDQWSMAQAEMRVRWRVLDRLIQRGWDRSWDQDDVG